MVRQLVGVTGQYASVDENLTARENLYLFGRLLGVDKKKSRSTAEDLLGRFGLEDAGDKQISQFSGGMRRRLDLAASLISQPPLIFLDEPTTGLDPRTRGQMWETIRELVAQGCTVLLTTQYLDEADQLADRIAVIDRGVKVAEGTSDQLKSQVGSSTLQLRLLDPAQTAQAVDVVRRVVGDEPVLTPEAGGINVPLPDANRAADVLIGLREQELLITSATVQKPTLDEVFMALTGHARRGRRHDRDREGAGPMTLLSPTVDETVTATTHVGARDLPARPSARRHRQPDHGHGLAGDRRRCAATRSSSSTSRSSRCCSRRCSPTSSAARSPAAWQDYLPIIITGLLAQTALTACMATGIQLREDMDKGVFDRFKSLPIARIAPLAGPAHRRPAALRDRLDADHPHRHRDGLPPRRRVPRRGSRLAAHGHRGLVDGLDLRLVSAPSARSAQAVQGISMMIMFPLTFLSNAFVPADTLPHWLQTFVNINPVCHVISAVRDLVNEGQVTAQVGWALLGCAIVVGGLRCRSRCGPTAARCSYYRAIARRRPGPPAGGPGPCARRTPPGAGRPGRARPARPRPAVRRGVHGDGELRVGEQVGQHQQPDGVLGGPAPASSSPQAPSPCSTMPATG